MRINKEKRIGQVLFIVEGSSTEFNYLYKIFCGLLGYSYVAKKRNTPDYYVKDSDPYSRVAVVNTRESNIRDISENPKYLDEVFDVLRERYHFPVEQSAIYYLFDRDPESNTNIELIEKYIKILANPYDNEDGEQAGQLLLSYPSIESFIVSNFIDETINLYFGLGKEVKNYIGKNKQIQLNKISDKTLIKAAYEFMNYLTAEEITWDIDDFAPASFAVFTKQEANYLLDGGFRLFSMLTLALFQMGILELDK